ncbi:armadillo repeat-containing protein 8-like [Triticum dicoccoides]|uniref:armadillo repeat-containing protein 8-like n=1 Tax=Triticum dicoccoides TaxID=85692 RepID=UPI00189049F5|nr:armadillo repeat-containing protein 8-like [Triticum dicoccoides]
MPATASGGARAEEAASAPSVSSSAPFCMGTRPEELAARLVAGGPGGVGGPGGGRGEGGEGEHERVLALREIKNQIIGNRTKKLLYLRLGAVPAVVAALAKPGASPAALVQAAAAAGSFACGVDDGARAVLAAGAVGHLTRLLAHPDDKVVDACARALRMIYQSKQAPRFDVNNEKNMDFLLSLLDSENENVTELAANIISYSCNSNTEQLALCGAGVPQKLVSLFGGSMNLRDACLESMTAVIRNNWEVASRFASMDHGKAFRSIVALIHDRSPRTRLLACLCLIALGHASPCHFPDRQNKTKLILVLLELIEEPGHVGDEAPLALTTLIKDSVELQKQAFSTNAVAKLSNHLLANTLETRRAVTILLALAELCSKQEESRSQLMSGQVSTLILDALKHDCVDIRVAACSCLKNISRSSKVLSAGRLSCDTVIAPLVQLLYDSSTSVQIAALGAICNIAVNLTPRKTVLLHSGVVSQLVHLSKSMDPTLRLKSVLALRNIMFLMNPKDKDLILKELTTSTLSSLICDSEHSVQEQTLALVQNLLDGYVDSVNYVIGEDGMVINAISRQLNSASATGVCIQGMLVLANMAAGNELNKEAVMDVTVPHRADRIKPSFVVNFLQSKDKQLRVATLWCILNLIYPNSDSSSTRVAQLQNAGVISQVKNMINDPCLDCKLRVRMVLEHCLDNAAAGFM